MKYRVLIGAMGLSVLMTGIGLAQSASPESEANRRTREPSASRADDPAMLRARLERTITRTESMLDRHREALTRLDAGESPGEVMRSLRSRETGSREPGSHEAGSDDASPIGPAPRGQDNVGGGPRDKAGPDDRAAPELTPEARRRLRGFLRDHLPSVHEQLAQIERQDNAIGATLFDRMIPQLREIATEMERNPAFGALKLEEMRTGLGVVDATQHLRSLAADAPPEIRAEAESALRAAIASRFDARIRLREHELERLAARISELHEQIKDERAGRDAEIEKVYESVIAQRWARPGRGPADRRPERP